MAVAAVLLAYPVWMGFDGPQHFTGPPSPRQIRTTTTYSAFWSQDHFNESHWEWRHSGPAWLLGAVTTEAGGYIGVPVIILTGYLALRSRRSPRMQLAVVLLFVAALLSLGPHLAIDGRLTHLPLPFWLLDHLPLVNGILPVRISLEVDACLAAVIAFGLDDMRRAPVGPRSGSLGERGFECEEAPSSPA